MSLHDKNEKKNNFKFLWKLNSLRSEMFSFFFLRRISMKCADTENLFRLFFSVSKDYSHLFRAALVTV